ncbi:MAG: glycine cleavage system aminomethyltransferase GcvT [Sphingomonadaceae bacterium]|nr:glycine cleavage system aminomethyltransferase GcvT [Sphingomonadaceae bacterium]
MSKTDTLPLDSWHRAQGGRMVDFAGYQMPIQYEGIMAEHLWTRQSAGLFDVSHMGQIQLIGEGAAEALEAIVPGDISALKPGRMRYTLLLAPDGGILDDLMVTNAGEQLYLVVNGATKHDDIAYLRENLPDSVTINHLEGEGLLALQGPKAADALARLDISGIEEGWPGPGDLYFMQSAPCRWGDVPLGVSRSGYTGEDGFEISVPAAHVEAFAEALAALDEVKSVGLGARDSLRLEAGLPLYGHDLTPETLPVEAGLTFALSKKRRGSADFAGAERILAQYPDKADRLRAGLVIEGRQPVREGAIVVDDNGAEIGQVTSGGFSPTLAQPIAMAYVPAALAAPGTKITIEQRGKPFTGIVTPMPFVPQNYHRPPKSTAKA